MLTLIFEIRHASAAHSGSSHCVFKPVKGHHRRSEFLTSCRKHSHSASSLQLRQELGGRRHARRRFIPPQLTRQRSAWDWTMETAMGPSKQRRNGDP
jgi:hypothetical protein